MMCNLGDLISLRHPAIKTLSTKQHLNIPRKKKKVISDVVVVGAFVSAALFM